MTPAAPRRPRGIRHIRLTGPNGENIPAGAVASIEITFGRDFLVDLSEDDSGELVLDLRSTHHGFRASTGDRADELRRLIEHVRRALPELKAD